MSDKAHKQTDKKLAAMEKHVREIYVQAEGDMRVKWEEFMENAAKRTETLQKRYEAALQGGDPKEIQEAKEALQQRLEYVTFRSSQYRDMVEQMAANYEHANEIALAYVNGKLPEIYALNYNYMGKNIAEQVGGKATGYSFNLVNAHTVKELATKNKSLLPTKKVNVPKDKRWNTKQINAQVMQGIVQGESIPKIAKRLQNVTDMTSAAAVRNARTMVTGAQNSGRVQSAAEAINNGVMLKKCWLATKDERTRDWHMDLNGEQVENDEPFNNDYGDIMYPGDPTAHPANVYNCRCTLTYKVTGFKKAADNAPQTDENSGLTEQDGSGIIESGNNIKITAENAENFQQLKGYMMNAYNICVSESVGSLDFESVKEGVQGIEYIINQFPQAKSSFKSIGTNKNGLMCAGYDGDINFNPATYKTREGALRGHGIGEGITPSGLHPKGNNCFGSGCHESGHLLEKALIDKMNGSETMLGRIMWETEALSKSIVSDACKTAKKLPECKGMANSSLRNQISRYAGEASKYSASETLAEAVCDYSLNGENAAPLSKIIWETLKKELG
ncbi:MAG: phage head morphogenesis protein [Ruminococcus sp.]|nr:phage head morphogenesis protein [Ruminococcus sp.]MCM1380324.1 phage head morphogenesis protein [Muribaculaceae bacterium]MCM1478236.1 phage head morphogenesis protein [Muribaculaceae bacterium]